MSRADASVQRLNALSPQDAREAMLSCCRCARWADDVLRRRPFADSASLLTASEAAFDRLERRDWLEAFSHHPRIGERTAITGGPARDASTAAREQSGMAAASDAERAEFVRGNEEYERRFGHVFLICATGKSPAQMLGALRTRLENQPAQELSIAAREQRQITRLRLERWLNS